MHITPQLLNVIGLCLNIAGSLVVALCLNKFFSWITLSIGVSDMNQNATSGMPIYTGHSQHTARAYKIGAVRAWVGVVLLISGFICQLIASLSP